MLRIYTLGRWNVRTVRPMEHTFVRAKVVHTVQRITIINFPKFGESIFLGNVYLFYYAPCGTCFRKH